MARSFSTSIEIQAPAEVVWGVMTDWERWPEWTPSVTAITRLDAGPPRIGSRARIQQPKLRPAVWTVASWSPRVEFTWVTRSPGVTVTGEHAVAPRGAGCQATLRVTFRGLLAGLAGLFAGRLTRKYLSAEADGLKRRAESLTDPVLPKGQA